MSFNINSAIQSQTAVLIGSSNYSTWACQVCNLLTMATWWDIVSGASTYAAQADAAAQTTWNSNDRQAQLLISVFIHQDMQHLQKNAYVAAGGVAHPSLAKDLWDQLAALYVPTGITSQSEAFSQALGIWIIDPSDHSNRRRSDDLPITMASQINALTSTYDKMSTAGLQLPDNLRTMILLNALPSSYRPLVSTIIQTTTAADFTLDITIPKVISEAQLRSTSQINYRALMHRLFTSGPDRSEANWMNTIQHAPSKPICTHCGKGHLSKNCWQVHIWTTRTAKLSTSE